MSKISAEVVADSLNAAGCRLITMRVTLPRFILAELNTHRMFSRNSASSRAIPFNKMLESVQTNPFVPIAWQKDHKGMQGTNYFNSDDASSNKGGWLRARDCAVCQAKYLSELGLTKQLCNRLLEPFMWHTVLISTSDLENFFELRCPQYAFSNNVFRSWKDLLNSIKDLEGTYQAAKEATTLEKLMQNKGQSEIHMMTLAEAMWDAMNGSKPKQLKAGEWHTPFGEDFDEDYIHAFIERDNMPSLGSEEYLNEANQIKVRIATARCARISYTVVGEGCKEPNYDNDLRLHDRLLDSGHLSPFEHCAQATEDSNYYFNFKGFKQYRYQIQN